MFTSIKTKILYIAKSLTDLKILGQVFFVFIVLLVSWSGIKAIGTNYELQKKISKLQQEVEIQKLENDNLKLSNQYLETDQFLELAARRQFGKAAPGETVLIVPKEVSLSYVDKSTTEGSKKRAQEKKPAYQQNFQDWINFFFRKSQNKLLSD